MHRMEFLVSRFPTTPPIALIRKGARALPSRPIMGVSFMRCANCALRIKSLGYCGQHAARGSTRQRRQLERIATPKVGTYISVERLPLLVGELVPGEGLRVERHGVHPLCTATAA